MQPDTAKHQLDGCVVIGHQDGCPTCGLRPGVRHLTTAHRPAAAAVVVVLLVFVLVLAVVLARSSSPWLRQPVRAGHCGVQPHERPTAGSGKRGPALCPRGIGPLARVLETRQLGGGLIGGVVLAGALAQYFAGGGGIEDAVTPSGSALQKQASGLPPGPWAPNPEARWSAHPGRPTPGVCCKRTATRN